MFLLHFIVFYLIKHINLLKRVYIIKLYKEKQMTNLNIIFVKVIK